MWLNPTVSCPAADYTNWRLASIECDILPEENQWWRVFLNCVTLQHFGTSQSWTLSLSECLKVRCGIWLICLCDLAFLGSLSEQFSEISGLWRHVAPTFCPAESVVPVLVIAWERTRRCDPDVQCLIETRTQPLNCKHCLKYHLHKSIKANIFYWYFSVYSVE